MYFLLVLVLLQSFYSYQSSLRTGEERAIKQSKDDSWESVGQRQFEQSVNNSAGVVVVVRQPLFNYATQIGIQYLEADVSQLPLPDFYRRLELPFLGTIKVYVHNMTIDSFTVNQSKSDVVIKDNQFHVQVSNLETKISFQWSYRVACIGGQGHGSLALKEGFLNMGFYLNSGEFSQPQLVVNSTHTKFDKVDIELEAEENNWFYQTLLGLSQNWIDQKIVMGIDRSLRRDFPLAINQVLNSLPQSLNLSNIPVQIEVRYAFQTTDFFAAEAFDTFVAFLGNYSSKDTDVVCPYKTKNLQLSTEEIAEDQHMMTIFGHQSVVNCLLWSLQQSHSLDATVKQGDIPGLNFITIIFSRFIPGIQTKYPGKYVQLEVTQKQAPYFWFQPGDRPIVFNMQFYQDVYVNLNENLTGSEDELVFICRLEANVTVQLDLQWNHVSIDKKDIDVNYTVLESPEFPVVTDAFNEAMIFALTDSQSKSQLALGSLMNTYVKNKLLRRVLVESARVGGFREGWLGLSADLHLDTSTLFDPFFDVSYQDRPDTLLLVSQDQNSQAEDSSIDIVLGIQNLIKKQQFLVPKVRAN
eukprot:TRINITY_DN46338_c0_g1_i2.p1 TRINITY_DN46338_c0_g1~~TRINITY_DN46338_c0_g1_i2.p1  ORF type:complete len:626 (-),score=52.48 TRINITY_DN46338_c0_g1_i2:780-2522(-)